MQKVNDYLYAKIINYVEESIKNHSLEEGDKLPSERELAAQFKISRNVVREGIKILREKGLVAVQPGKGAFITKPDPLIVASTMERVIQNYDTTIEDVLEVREELELTIIEKAVKRANSTYIQKLYSYYNLMEQHKSNVHLFTEYDFKFHVTLAQATNNQLYAILLNSFVELTDSVLFAITRLTPDTLEKAQEQHWTLIQAIEERDEQKARKIMVTHMHLLRKDIKLLRKKKLL